METRDKYTKMRRTRSSGQVTMVKEIFSTIHRKYDFLNHLFSLRRDVFWRRFTAGKMRFTRTFRYLDVATGTADLAIETALYHRGVRVTALDFIQEMMNIGREKIKRKRLSRVLDLVRGDALQLPFEPDSFDVAGIAFGIRNIPDRLSALREIMRVVVPGGQVLILEMTLPANRFFRGLYNLYLNRILPALAGILSPNQEAYYYLGDSIMNFPSPEEFVGLMRQSGLIEISAHSLTVGIVHVYVGTKPAY